MWLDHDVLLALLEPFTAPAEAGAQYWRQGSPVAKYLDWRGIAWVAGGTEGAGEPHYPMAIKSAKTSLLLDWPGNRSWMVITRSRATGYWIPYSGWDRGTGPGGKNLTGCFGRLGAWRPSCPPAVAKGLGQDTDLRPGIQRYTTFQ
eukprot:608498-Amphidinium_carterae.1